MKIIVFRDIEKLYSHAEAVLNADDIIYAKVNNPNIRLQMRNGDFYCIEMKQDDPTTQENIERTKRVFDDICKFLASKKEVIEINSNNFKLT